MSEKKKEKAEDSTQDRGGIDPEVFEVIQEERHRRSGAAKRESSDRERILKIFSGKALRAIQAKDARAFAIALRQANVAENSPEWKRAWEFFHSACG